jgi:hypothetical protein
VACFSSITEEGLPVKSYIAYVLTYSLQARSEDAYSYVLAVTKTKPNPEQIMGWKIKIAVDYIESEYYAPDEISWEQIDDVWVLKTDNDHFDELRIIEVDTDENTNELWSLSTLNVSPLFGKPGRNNP